MREEINISSVSMELSILTQLTVSMNLFSYLFNLFAYFFGEKI